MEITQKKGSAGRPPMARTEALETIPTRCPESLHRYMKMIYPVSYSSLTMMFEEMLTRFIAQRPWEHGLDWRKPRSRIERSGGVTAATGWCQVNVQTTASMKEKITAIAKTTGVTNSVFVYTAMFWWSMYIMPARSVKSGRVSR